MPWKLYCAWYCPFAQRVWMTLLHKSIAFDYVEVDPFRKSQWWLDISRNRATVPVIVRPGKNGREPLTVVESTRIVEYLDELTPTSNPLFPTDLDQRAEHRFWVDHVNEHIVPFVYQHLAAKEPGEERDVSKAALLEGLEALGAAIAPDGPFFSGDTLSAVDLLMIPFAYRIDTLLGHYRDLVLPDTGPAWTRYTRWYARMCELEAFKATSTDHSDYRDRLIEHYLPYSRGEVP